MATNRQVSLRQLEMLLECMEQHPDLATGRVRSREGRAKSEKMWSELATTLNAEGGLNSYRTAKEWNRFYNDYKCRVRTKARKIITSQQQTGGGPPNASPLTPMEDKLCAIIGPDKFSPLPVQFNPVVIHQVEPSQISDLTLTEDTIDFVAPTQSPSLIPPDNEMQIEYVPSQEYVKDISTPLRPSRKGKERRPHQKPLITEVDETRNVLVEMEKARLELLKSQLEVDRKRNEIETEKVKKIEARNKIEQEKVDVLNCLVSAVWAVAKGPTETSPSLGED